MYWIVSIIHDQNQCRCIYVPVAVEIVIMHSMSENDRAVTTETWKIEWYCNIDINGTFYILDKKDELVMTMTKTT